MRTDRAHDTEDQVCEKWTLTFLQINFPVTGFEFPVPENIFPVNL
jgi:hypothetical protein